MVLWEKIIKNIDSIGFQVDLGMNRFLISSEEVLNERLGAITLILQFYYLNRCCLMAIIRVV